MSRISSRGSFKRKLQGFVLAFGFLVQTMFPYSALAVAPAEGLTTLRQGLKNGLKMKVNGDGVNTTQVSLQLTNTTNQPMQVVIPANEMLKPNTPSVQNMMVTMDQLVSIPPGQTAIVNVQTVCASVKTVPPPPQVTEGLNFEVGDYADSAMWAKIAQIIAAGKELAMMGAFGNNLMLSEEAIRAQIDKVVQEEIQRLIDQGLNQLPANQRGDAQRSAIEQQVRQNMNDIQQRAERQVRDEARQRQIDQITQLAIWNVLGIQSPNPADKVNPTSMADDMIKQLASAVQANPALLQQIGGTIDKKGNYSPSEKQKEKLEERTSAIFDLVNLTVSRAGETEKIKTASLPKDDPCDTFCNVGERAFEQGDYAEAQALLEQAVVLAESSGEADPRYSRALNSLGMCFLDTTAYDQAQASFKKALEIREKVFGPKSKEVGETNDNLGQLFQHRTQYMTSDNHFNTAINIFDDKIGKTSIKTAGSLNNLGKNFILEDRPQESNMPLVRALANAMANSPKDVKGTMLKTPFVADIETNMADALVAQGEYEKALNWYGKALETDKKCLGESHPFLARIYDGMATAESKSGKASASESYKKLAADIREKTLGKENMEIAMMPLGSDAFTRLWNYTEGRKAINATIASVKAGSNLLKGHRDSSMVNTPIGDKWALVVGISKFKDNTINLQYAAKDATDFANYLKTEGNFTPDHVHLLTDEKATREEILDQLGVRWLPSVARKNDLVVIFFSSHGSPSSIDAGAINYVLAHDTNKDNLLATGIPLKSFAESLKDRLQCKRVVVIMDACHSGVAAGAKGMFRQVGPDADALAQGSGQLVICSSGRSQTSWESKRYNNGVFTHYLLEGLRKQGNQPKLGETFDYLSKMVAEEVQRDRLGEVQTPAMQSKWEGKDLVITSKPTDPVADLPFYVNRATQEAVLGAKGSKGTTGAKVNTATKGPAGKTPVSQKSTSTQKSATTVSSKSTGPKKPQTR